MRLPLVATVPLERGASAAASAAAAALVPGAGPPFPVVALINGFQVLIFIVFVLRVCVCERERERGAAFYTSSKPKNTPPPKKARASQYAPLARHLASWGFVVLQYNAPALTIVPDASELPFLGAALDWLDARARCEGLEPALCG